MLRFTQTYAKSNCWPRPHSGAFRQDLVGCIAPAMRPPRLAKIARNAAAPALTFFVTQGLTTKNYTHEN